MDSHNQNKLEEFLTTAGISPASSAAERIYYWTNGQSTLTETISQKVISKPTKTWDSKAIDSLVERTFFWPETIENIQSGAIGRAVNDHPQKKELLEIYLSLFEDFPVLADDHSLPEQELHRLRLVRTEDGYLQINNPIYKRVFNQDWAASLQVEPTVADRIRPWMTPKYIGGALWILILVLAAITLARWFSQNPVEQEVIENPQTNISEPIASATEPTSSDISAVSPTATQTTQPILPTATVPSTATKRPTQPPATSTKMATATHTPTKQPPTATVTTENTPTPEPTVATNTPAAAQPTFYQPEIQNMFCYAEWLNFRSSDQIKLNWFWNGRLQGSEYLEIRVGPRGGNLNSIGKVFAEPNSAQWEWFITPQGYFLDGTTREFQWQVAHMTGDGRITLAVSARGCFTVN